MKEQTTPEYCEYNSPIISKLQLLGSRFASLVSIIILLLFAAQRAQGQSSPEAYVWINDKTLTFCYDANKPNRSGSVYELNKEYDAPNWVHDKTYKTISKVVFEPSFKDVKPVSCSCWFADLTQLTDIIGIENLNTSEVVFMHSMFYNCRNLTSIDLSHFNTANVRGMEYMFDECRSLTTLNLSKFNSDKLITYDCMFRNCCSLKTIYASGSWKINTYNPYVFIGCTNLVGGKGTQFDSGHTRDEYARIDGGPSHPGYLTLGEAYVCKSTEGKTLTFFFDDQKSSREGTIYDLNTGSNKPKWITDDSNETITTVVFDPSFKEAWPTSCADWFSDMTQLTEIVGIENLNTYYVTQMCRMFYGCNSLTTLDLSHFNTAYVTDLSDMFNGSSNLRTIYVSDIWTTNIVTNSNNMFTGCTKLKGGEGTTFNNSHTDKEYAHPDGGQSAPGYLTLIEAYACKSDEGKTLTFFFDGQKSSRDGAIYSLNTGSNNPEWTTDDSNGAITKVVFDSSFKEARPTSCAYWFLGMSQLTEIVGIENLNTYNVTNMAGMFCGCSSLTKLDVSKFNTIKVTDMSRLFEKCSSVTNLIVSNFNTNNVTDMSFMFNRCSNLTTLDLSHFNTTNVIDMHYMFSNCSSLTTLNLNKFNTDNVTDMKYMFCNCSSLTTLNLCKFDTDDVIDMRYMFSKCSSLETIYVSGEWDTDKVTNSNYMFAGCTKLKGSEKTIYNESHIDKEYARIDGGKANPGYLTGFKQPYVENNGYSLTFLYGVKPDGGQGQFFDLNEGDEIPDWVGYDRTLLTMNYFLLYNIKIVFDASFANARPTSCAYWFAGGNTQLLTIEGLEYLNTSEVTTMQYMFYRCSELTSIDVSKFNTSKVNNMSCMFDGCSSLEILDVSNFNTDNVTYMNGMFSLCSKLEELDVRKFNTANVTDMNGMFYGCHRLKTLDVSNFNTAKVTDMRNMFFDCYSLENIAVGNFNTDNVVYMDGMFNDCNTIKNLDVRGFNTTKVTDMEGMFFNCNNLETLDVSNFNTANVKDMNSMFFGCNALKILDVSKFNTDNVTDMGGMFYGCSSLENIDVSKFNTDNVTEMYSMFAGCSKLTALDLSNFNTTKVTEMYQMFEDCSSLTAILVSDKWDPNNVNYSYNMFRNTNSIIGNKGTIFNQQQKDKTYACIDDGGGNPGYLTTDKYKIFYDLDGDGTIDKPVESPFENAVTEYFNEKINLTEPTKDNYTFIGWTGTPITGLTEPTRKVTIQASDAGNRIYTANWKLRPTITAMPTASAITYGQTLAESQLEDGAANMPGEFAWDEGTIKPNVSDSETTEYEVVFTPSNTTEYGPVSVKIKLKVNKATQNAPTLTATDETIAGKTDGKINGLTTEMEISTTSATSGYAAVTDANITNGFAPGTYYVRYDESANYTVSPATTVTIGAGRQLVVTFICDVATYSPVETTYNTTISAPTDDPEKEGYTFAGWFDGSVKFDFENTKITEDKDITAGWQPIKYTITYNLNGGALKQGESNPTEYTIESDDITLYNPEKEGYTFSGWYDGTTTAATVTIAKGSTGEKAYTAVYEPIKYKITFDTDGAGAIDPIVADYQSAITAPKDPVKEGYTFAGWIPNIPATMPLDGLTVKAQWTKNQYTLKFMTDETTVYKQVSLDFGAAIAAPADPEKYGFNFGGWQPEVPQTMPAADLTISAIWLAQGQYVIRFVTQGGTAIDPIVGFAGDAVTPPADPTREGYTFTGWDKPVPTVMPEANTEITALWKAISYTVTYNAGNGSEPVTVSYNFGAAIATPQQPTREGYTFDGWDAAIPATMPAANLTFNARWKINQYTLTFMADATTVYEQITQDFGTAVAAPKNPQRDGYIFGGWDKAVPTTMPAENVTLTAQWAQGEYTITFMTDETTVYKVVAQDYGTTVSAPSDPVRNGYIFIGWDKAVPATMPAENITLTAQWQKAAITVAETEIVADTRNEYFCNGYAVAAFTVTAGNPTKYTIEFAEGGIENATGSLTGSSIEIALPKGLSAGTYTGSLQLADAEGNASPRIPLTLTVSLPFYTIVPLYVDVAAVNKLAGNFTAYQWNENGVALAGETQHYLHRDFSASGVYTVTLTLADGSVRETCPLDLTRVNAARRAASVKVYPNPATRDGHVTVEVTENYDPSADKMLSIFSISGAQVKQIPNPQDISTLQLPQGTYTGVYEQNGERTTFKVLVK